MSSVELVGITTVGVGVGVLPDGPKIPTAWKGTNGISIVGEHEGISRGEGVGVSGASLPP